MNAKLTTIIAAEEVTPEILEVAESVYDGWYADRGRVDWTDFLERLEKMVTFDDGTRLDLGESLTSPAILKVKRHIDAYRKL